MSISPLRLGPLVGVLALSPLAAGQTLFADANLTTGANDGSSWANAFQGEDGLQAALTTVASGTDVWAAEGTYRTSASGNRGDSFRLVNGVTVYGGFQGGEAALAARPEIGAFPSIMTADQNGDDGSGVISDNSYHVVRTNNTNATAVLDGFTVVGGNANVSGSNRDRGGGILCVNGWSPTIRNCSFEDNVCDFGGGAGYISGSAPSFTDTSFINNDGGAFGGAFDIAGANGVRFDRCLFEGNSAARAGGLEIFSTSNTIVNNSVFVGNVATGNSGGGGIWVGSGGNPRFVNCTVVGNTATSSAVGGLRNQGSTNATFVNMVLWGNTGNGGAMSSSNQINSGNALSYSLVMGGYAGATNSGADPLFVDQVGGDLSLNLTSPGIDAGDSTALAAGLVLDFAGNPRFTDIASAPDTGVGPAPVVDVGAFEASSGAFASISGCSGNAALLDAGTSAFAVGQPLALTLTAGAYPDGISLYYAGRDGTGAAGCGLVLPGTGELLLSAINPLILLGTAPMAAGSSALASGVPANPALVGQTYGLQAANVSTVLPGTPIELSQMLLGTIAP